MSFTRMRLAACAALVIALATPAPAQTTTTQWPKSTPVELTVQTRLPGITLEPGRYTFRLFEPARGRSIVEVYSTDGTRRIGRFLTVDYTTAPAANTPWVTFPNTTPAAWRVWYFPGDSVGREFVWTQDESTTLHTSANAPVLWAAWDPDRDLPIGTIEIQTAGKTIGQAIGDAARAVAGAAKEVWDDINDNARLANPTDTRKAAERHLDAAERDFDQLEERVGDDVERRLISVKTNLEALEDAYEKDQPWMTHYTALVAALDTLSPERPVGTSGAASGGLDASVHAALASIRGHLKAFHAQAMK